MIHFACPACGAAFDLDERLAGRTGRCKACGERMKVPSKGAAGPKAPAGPKHPSLAAIAASVGGIGAGPRLTPIAPDGLAPRPGMSLSGGRPLNWLEAVNSQVALAPISADNFRGLRSRPSPMDEPSIPGPYKLRSMPSLPAYQAAAAGSKPAGAVTRGYRRGMGSVQKAFRWLNEGAYFLSIPFVMCAILGLVLRNHALLVFGAVVVILLNLTRVVTGVINLAVVPFRQGPLQGVLFLIPPFTFVYVAKNWHKVHKPVMRILGPIATIGLVALALLAEPWLPGGKKPEGSVQDEATRSLGAMTGKVQEELKDLPALKKQGMDALRDAASALKPKSP
ncbi:hypothetical protein OJF2_32050 [Aquisphaera giovannonii]|uniref:Uncharacterized protein n=2 Tax=Aquisphaera giovannonii TaxID=406548 RepID=A0A5B9W352_9BACT|nr:hypothetical protein OJF2_32050 [Aquisphaera giovannonii]